MKKILDSLIKERQTQEIICPIMTERCQEKRFCCQPGYCNDCGYYKIKNKLGKRCLGCKVNMKKTINKLQKK